MIYNLSNDCHIYENEVDSFYLDVRLLDSGDLRKNVMVERWSKKFELGFEHSAPSIEMDVYYCIRTYNTKLTYVQSCLLPCFGTTETPRDRRGTTET